ncbi:MAG: adenylate/guanylate cyclase domain-containing protein [Spirochaetaceae bacterium]|jgi:adenylate cyclase|nr:adenylate/guanylate cyclase domain-containing protein [Spirochaetaceae bacterium]
MIISLFLSCTEQKQEPNLTAIDGTINLNSYPLEQMGTLNLDGYWEFYWNEFLYHDDFSNNLQRKNRELINIPGSWSKLHDYSAYGYGTLRLTITGLNRDKTYSLYIPEMLTAFRFILNGTEIYTNGTVGKEKKDSKPQFLPGTVTFETDTGSVEMICQISNFDYRNSGIWRSITLGSDNIIQDHRERKLLLEMFLSAVLLAISFFHIGIYFYRKEAKAELLFGLTCLVLFFRTITTGEQILNFLLPDFPWEIARRMEFTPFFLVAPLFMTFLTTLFPEESIKILNKIFLGVFSLLGAFYIIFPVRITNNAILLSELLLISGIVYAFSVLIRALIKKRNHSFPIIAAISILAISSINDILFSRQIIQTMYLSSLGFLLFIIIQSQMLSRRYARSFRKVQALSLQLKGINESLSRFVPFQFLNYLKKNSILEVNLGDQVLENMTILFADIRSFTSLSEVMTPEENFKFLNSFLSQVVPVIREQGGFVDKFIGDAIMALFPFPPDKAVKAAVELQKAVISYNEGRNRAGYSGISLGIGIHTGQLMLGTIGETNRMETTVIADAVNIASRLESLTKTYGSRIIISRELYNKLENTDSIISRSLGDAPVKGKSKPIEILEILDGESPGEEKLKIENLKDFEKAILSIKAKDYNGAAELLRLVLDKNPEDTAAILFLKHCIDCQLNHESGE